MRIDFICLANRYLKAVRCALTLTVTCAALFTGVANAEGTPPKLMQIDTGIFRGVQPQPDDYPALKAAGITTIVNLRWDKSVAQSKADAEAAGFKFVNVPINAVEGPSAQDTQTVLQTLRDNKDKGVLFHCTLGRDRTGLMAALYRVLVQRKTPKEAYAEWTSFGFSNAFLKKLDADFFSTLGIADPDAKLIRKAVATEAYERKQLTCRAAFAG